MQHVSGHKGPHRLKANAAEDHAPPQDAHGQGRVRVQRDPHQCGQKLVEDSRTGVSTSAGPTERE